METPSEKCFVKNGRVVLVGPTLPQGVFIHDFSNEITHVEGNSKIRKLFFTQGNTKFNIIYGESMISLYKTAKGGFRFFVVRGKYTNIRFDDWSFFSIPKESLEDITNTLEDLISRVLDKYKSCYGVDAFDRMNCGVKKDSLG